MKKIIIFVSSLFFVTEAFSHHFYNKFPVTLKGYSGSKTNSVSYSGQIARHVLHDSLKKRTHRRDPPPIRLLLAPLHAIQNRKKSRNQHVTRLTD